MNFKPAFKNVYKGLGFGVLFVLVMLYTGCSTDEGTPSALCRIKVKTLSDGSTETYSYNAVGLVSKIEYNYAGIGDPLTGTMTMQFDGSGKLTGATLGDNSTYTVGYDGSGRIIEIEYSPAEGAQENDYPSVTTYTYGTVGFIDKIQTELIKEPENQTFYYRYEFNAAGNLAKEYYHNGTSETLRRAFLSYDNNKNGQANTPFNTIYIYGETGYPVKLRSFFDPSWAFANNPLEYTFHSGGGGTTDYEIEYSYNEFGYPTASLDNFGDLMTYTYECL